MAALVAWGAWTMLGRHEPESAVAPAPQAPAGQAAESAGEAVRDAADQAGDAVRDAADAASTKAGEIKKEIEGLVDQATTPEPATPALAPAAPAAPAN